MSPLHHESSRGTGCREDQEQGKSDAKEIECVRSHPALFNARHIEDPFCSSSGSLGKSEGRDIPAGEGPLPEYTPPGGGSGFSTRECFRSSVLSGWKYPEGRID